jgi:hypothetical protein
VKKIIVSVCMLFSSNCFAQSRPDTIDTIDSQKYGNASFSGSVDFVKRQVVIDGRFCNQARKLNFGKSLPLEVEGPRLGGSSDILANGTVNGRPGTGFLMSRYKDLPPAFNLVSAPSDRDPTPRGRQAAACGVFSLDTKITKFDDEIANAEHSIYVGCRERGNGRRLGNFYVCHQVKYKGQLSRKPR